MSTIIGPAHAAPVTFLAGALGAPEYPKGRARSCESINGTAVLSEGDSPAHPFCQRAKAALHRMVRRTE